MPPRESNFLASQGFAPYSFIERGSNFEHQDLSQFQAMQMQRRQNHVIHTENYHMLVAQREEEERRIQAIQRRERRERTRERRERQTMRQEDIRSMAAQSHYHRQLEQQLNRGEITQEQYNRLRGKPKSKKRHHAPPHGIRKPPPGPPRPPGGGGGFAMTIR
jgi:hypothetical protein